MLIGMRNAFIAATMAIPAFCQSATAEVPLSAANAPAMQALLNAPAMRNGLAAGRRGNQRQAAVYFRQGAAQGNDLAELVLARMYFEGLGTAKNYTESLRLVKAVLVKKQEPTYDMALELLDMISRQLRGSTNPADRQMALAASILPLAAMMPNHARMSGGGTDSGSDFWAHRAFDEMTDHEFDPFDSGD